MTSPCVLKINLVALLVLGGPGACGMHLGGPPPYAALSQAAPGTFKADTTFALDAHLEGLRLVAPSPDELTKLSAELDNGCAKAEHEFKRDSFITNPRLANRNVLPPYKLEIDVEPLDTKGPFARISATIRVVDTAGAAIEQVVVESGSSKRSSPFETELHAVQELGYRVAAYMVCRTGDRPLECTPH